MKRTEHRQEKVNRFVHRLSREKIIESINLSTEDKLNWLEEANKFVNVYVDPDKLKLWRKLRQRIL